MLGEIAEQKGNKNGTQHYSETDYASFTQLSVFRDFMWIKAAKDGHADDGTTFGAYEQYSVRGHAPRTGCPSFSPSDGISLPCSREGAGGATGHCSSKVENGRFRERMLLACAFVHAWEESGN
jgi:hypothetical protein